MCFKLSFLIVISVSLVFSSPSGRLELESTDRNRIIGAFCFLDSDCPLANTICQNHFCDCEDGFTAVVEQDGIARCHVHTNLQCPASTNRCVDPNAECTARAIQNPNGWWSTVFICLCKPDFVYNPTFSQCQLMMGKPCQANTPCVSGNCNPETGLCTCAAFLVPSTDHLSCGAGIGSNCGTIACADANSACLSNICTCNHSFQPSQKSDDTYHTCRKRFGASCEEDSHCADEQMTCNEYSKGPRTEESKACICQPGYVPNDARTSCLSSQGVMGGPCSVSNQCTSIFGRHAVCSNNVCACFNGYSYDWQSTRCVRT